MRQLHRGPVALVALTIGATSLSWAGWLLAVPTGKIGVSKSGLGCSCHAGDPNANGDATVTIEGPTTLLAGQSGNYTIRVSGGPPSFGGGFNLSADAGVLQPGAGSQLLSGELTHTDPGQREWTFAWQAPASPGTARFFAVAQAVNNDGTNAGDSWNWYGDAPGAPFTIQVTPSAGVGSADATLRLAPPAPNPSAGPVSIDFALAARGPAVLDVVDLSGRRVRRLHDGVLGGGVHRVRWDGRDDRGEGAAPGVYWVRLASGGERRTVRLIRLGS